jgi:hypothetical protein
LHWEHVRLVERPLPLEHAGGAMAAVFGLLD